MTGSAQVRRTGAVRRVDGALYALFSRHADRTRHEADRRRFRGADLSIGFEIYLARVYAASWLAFLATAAATFAAAVALPDTTVAAVARTVHAGVPVVDRVSVPAVPRTWNAAGTALAVGLAAKRGTVAAGGRYLGWRSRARRADIERTLPGAVRYLRALSAGSDDQRELLGKVADSPDAYGETAVAMRRVLNKASLAGSLREGLRLVARDTPSRDLLAPFLLKFREHAEQGPDELADYLQMESRVLGHRQSRARERAGSYLELVAELFVVLLVLPALLVIVLTVMGVLAPGLGAPVRTPLGATTVRALLLYGSAGFVLLVGAGATLVVESLRPAGLATTTYGRPGGVATLRSALSNPASAAVVALPLGLAAAAVVAWLGYDAANVALLGYVGYAVPVGLVATRRARRDDAKDREITDLVHAVAGHVSLGRPFGEAVELVAREVDLGPLEPDVADLALNAGLTTGAAPDVDRRTAALDRFVDAVGTPLAEQTMGLVTGALSVGSDADDVFETLQTEIGRLHHEKEALRSNMAVYVAVGWTTALLLVGIMVAVNAFVLDGFAQLGSVSGPMASSALAPDAVQPERDRYRFYIVTQATMLASGWFAGTASRGRYAALLHSGLLVLVAYFVFAGVGML
ncbi:MAG: type II secretion system F family protein [Halobacteriales archaeon]